MLAGLSQDVRYSLRSIRRAPLFAASVAATVGLGLGLLCSAFTVVNAYVLTPIDLPDAEALVALEWDTERAARRRFAWGDFERLAEEASHFSALAAGTEAMAMRDGQPLAGLLVSDEFFTLLGVRAALGRTLRTGDGEAVGAHTVVLSDRLWRAQYGADEAVVGSSVTLGRQRFEVVGVMPAGFGVAGSEMVGFWVPLSSAGAFGVVEPRREPDVPRLWIMGRLRQRGTEAQAQAWLRVWLERRFPAGSPNAPRAVRLQSLATRFPLNEKTLALVVVILSAFGLVLLVACANVTNLMLARALARQRELAVRLSLGASRWRVMRQLTVESLLLAAPAAGMGLALTTATARIFPALVVATFPDGIVPVEDLLAPMDPDLRVMALLCVAAVGAAIVVALVPSARMAGLQLSRAARGDAAWDPRRSRLRTGLVATQIGACVLFLVGATALVDQTRRIANSDSGLSYERVASVRLPDRLRGAVAARLVSHPAVERVGTAWAPPMMGPLPVMNVLASDSLIARPAGFMVVSPDYFSIFDIRVVRGRTFTTLEADGDAAVVVVSAATARALWPGLDPLGRTLDLRGLADGGPDRRPRHGNLRVIGVVEDVASGSPLEGPDPTCVYFATGIGTDGPMSLLVQGRSAHPEALRAAVADAVDAIEPDTAFQFVSFTQLRGGAAWVFGAFSTAASILGVVGLLLAFSGTYAVVSFLATQRQRELGVRIALGATSTRIVVTMLADTLSTALLGLGAGLAMTMAMARLAGSINELVPVFAPRPYALGVAIVLTSTLAAALLPALRAARVDLARALRIE